MPRTLVRILMCVFLAGSAVQAVTLSRAPAPEITGGNGARQDTVWFGGDDGNGIAFEGGTWDFDTIVSDPFQGWTAEEQGLDIAVNFDHVTRDSFLTHGDPCIPISAANPGMLWCGVHEDEAMDRGYVTGMGYGNDMFQRAFSPEYPIDPGADSVDVRFDYFNHTEPDYDYTYIYLCCFDGGGELIDEVECEHFTGVHGDPENLVTYDPNGALAAAGTLPAATETIQFEFRMKSDAMWSDEDGLWDCPCGPFGVDDVHVLVGGTAEAFDFDDGAQGWTFDMGIGIGAYMSIIPREIWLPWVNLIVPFSGPIEENVLSFVDVEGSPYDPPGLVPGQHQLGLSGPVPRSGYPPPEHNTTIVRWDHYANFPTESGAHYRIGYQYYPYTTLGNPEERWSPRMGQSFWFYASLPYCATQHSNLSTLDGQMGDPLPGDWDSIKVAYEILCSCDAFGTPPSVCTDEGNTQGAPLIDNVRVGLTFTPGGPPPVPYDCFTDGFGQRHPHFLEPSDRGNANTTYDLSFSHTEYNHWNADSMVVTGPIPTNEENRWLVELSFRVARKGARQDYIPEYIDWKARLDGNPEEDFVACLMDSCEIPSGAYRNNFCTYYHEESPAYDPTAGDLSDGNEILPDGIFVPGTRIEYYFRAYWYNGGAPPVAYYPFPDPSRPYEFEILPTMTLVPEEEFTVQWPCLLYIDAYNRGSETYIEPMLAELGIDYDKYDYACNPHHNAPLCRSFGGLGHNPGGWGNNGGTVEQFLGYRIILVSTSSFTEGYMDETDFQLFREWLDYTGCGMPDLRRSLLFFGDRVADIIDYRDPDFMADVLGATYLSETYRELNQDNEPCIYLEPATGAAFAPDPPGIALSSPPGPPTPRDYRVLEPASGTPGAFGNLDYFSYLGTGIEPYVHFAQVLRDNSAGGGANWMTAVHGFSLVALSERGCGGDCSSDSACIVRGGVELLRPMIAWMEDPLQPFEAWRLICSGADVDPRETHLRGAVNHLYACRPNPFSARAAIRFHLAQTGAVNLAIYDLSGRRIRTLIDDRMAAGEHTLDWDGMDADGTCAGAGMYWVQLRTDDGYCSSKRLLRVN